MRVLQQSTGGLINGQPSTNCPKLQKLSVTDKPKMLMPNSENSAKNGGHLDNPNV